MTTLAGRPAGGSAEWSPGTGARWRGLRPDLRARLVPALPTDRLGSWVWTLLVTLLAGFLRFNRLGIPANAPVFDETYYAHDSDSLMHHGVELGKNFSPNDPAFVVHPPLGKWMIGVGEWFHDSVLGGARAVPLVYHGTKFTYSAAGWRFSSAVVGTLSVLLLIRIVRRMTRSTLLGCIAGLLLTFDGLEFVQSRISMLDIFLMFWVLAAFGCLVADRDDGRRRLADRLEALGTAYAPQPKLGLRPWRVGMILCLGAALATKWDAVFYIALLLLVAFAWDVGARRSGGAQSPILAALRHDALPLVGLFLLLVPAIYVASWAGWFATHTGYDRSWASDPANRSHWTLHFLGLTLFHVPDGWSNAVPDVIRSWVHYQWQIYNFHANLVAKHPYQSHPFGWLLLARPVSYFYTSPQFGQLGCTAQHGCSREILGIGTPAIWWASIPALVACLWFWVAKHDWRAGVALLGTLVTIAAWVPSDTFHQRTMFFFYALPGLPFMVIAITVCLGYLLGPPGASLLRRQWGATVVGAYLVLVVLNFFWLYPILAAKVLPYARWHARIWFNSWI